MSALAPSPVEAPSVASAVARAAAPMTLAEIAERLKLAATVELCAINALEHFAAASTDPHLVDLTVYQVRRQGRAFGLALRVIEACAADPAAASVVAGALAGEA